METLKIISYWALVVTVPLTLIWAGIQWRFERKRWSAVWGVIGALLIAWRLYVERGTP